MAQNNSYINIIYSNESLLTFFPEDWPRRSRTGWMGQCSGVPFLHTNHSEIEKHRIADNQWQTKCAQCEDDISQPRAAEAIGSSAVWLGWWCSWLDRRFSLFAIVHFCCFDLMWDFLVEIECVKLIASLPYLIENFISQFWQANSFSEK